MHLKHWPSESREKKREMNLRFRKVPHSCDCGEMGIKHTSSGWACALCLRRAASYDNFVQRDETRFACLKWTSVIEDSMWRTRYEETKIPMGESLLYLKEIQARP